MGRGLRYLKMFGIENGSCLEDTNGFVKAAPPFQWSKGSLKQTTSKEKMSHTRVITREMYILYKRYLGNYEVLYGTW